MRLFRSFILLAGLFAGTAQANCEYTIAGNCGLICNGTYATMDAAVKVIFDADICQGHPQAPSYNGYSCELYPEESNATRTAVHVYGFYGNGYKFYAGVMQAHLISTGNDAICAVTDGDGANAGSCSTGNSGSGLGSCSTNGTNPINTGWRGNKSQQETDYVGSGTHPLRFARYYNSRGVQVGLTGNDATEIVGQWRHTYQRAVVLFGSKQKVAVYRPDGKVYVFRQSGSNWDTDAHIVERLTQTASGWQFITAEEETESYDNNGKLLSIQNRAGLVQTLDYDVNGRLTSVTDAFNRSLMLTYDASGRLWTLQDPMLGNYTYAYNANGNLQTVTYPTTKIRTYLYEDTNFPNALTGIQDETNARIATWAYDAQGRAISSEHGATGSGIDKSTVVYNPDGSASITDALGMARTFSYIAQFNALKNTGLSQPCPSCGGANAASTTYDLNGFIDSRTDFNGNVTKYQYDARGLESSRTEAYNTSLARTITTQWHPTFRLPTQIDEPGKRTLLVYNSVGDLIQQSITDTPTNATRLSTYTITYSSTVPGAFAKVVVDGPRTDVVDQTTYDYNAEGNISAITNALGHITQITAYDNNHRPLTIIDPNGLITTLTYTPRGHLATRRVGTTATTGELTTYAYDDAEQLKKITLPNGAFLAYTYDAAHRLTDITDQWNNHIQYTLDAAGNRTQEDIFDPNNTLRQTHSRVFDTLGRLSQDIGAYAGEITTFSDYDGNGNVRTMADPLNHNTYQQFDVFNRLAEVTDANNGMTDYGYTPLDQTATVIDPRRLVTLYTVNALDTVAQTQSADSGITKNTYDAAGNLLTRIDAKDQKTTYKYDALNRLIKETRDSGTVVTYSYDGGTNQKSRLTGMSDPSGSTTWTYDRWGRVLQKDQVHGSTITRTTKYSFDTTGQPASMTYPSGKVINYTWTNGIIAAVKIGTANIASNITYHPFGLPKTWLFNNGQTMTRIFDLNGRMTSNSLGTIHYDVAGRIDSAYGNTFGYDALDQLTSYNNGTIAHTYSLDANGNRTQQTVGSTANTYSIDFLSNRIQSVSAGTAQQTYVHDANGSVTSDGTLTLEYDTLNRVRTAKLGTTVLGTYTYNGLNQRIKKVAGSATTLYVFAEDGKLLGEYDSTGAVLQETVWRGDIPIAVLRPGTVVYYVHADHLNTPRKVYNNTKQLRWSWDVGSFGATTPNENPSGLGVVTYNLRFGGYQYFDAETGLHYNWYRYYDPKTGKFITADPIGLAGGINPFVYVSNNPLSYVDPLGLQQILPGPIPLPIPFPVTPIPNKSSNIIDDLLLKKSTPRWPSWPSDDSGDDAWPKDDKNFCIRTYSNCKQYKWSGNCMACLDRCLGSAAGDWPFDMCKPKKKGQCGD